MTDRIKVMFLCTHNSCRSQIAEALLRNLDDEHFQVFSAGLNPGPIHPMARTVLEEKGIDTRLLKPKDIVDFLGKISFNFVIIVCSRAEKECPSTFPLVQHRLFWPFDDPSVFQGSEAQKLDEFRKTRDEVESRLREWINELQQEGWIL